MRARRAIVHGGTALVLLSIILTAFAASADDAANGFDLSALSVPRAEIIAGGPPRDGIPRVDEPRFAAPADATWVAPNNPVLGVAVGGEAKSYPIHLIERHQVVNDTIGGTPVLVSHDPLAGAPRAFDRRVGERTLRFGISGLIHNHNFLLYDLETESLWVQYTGTAISGPLAGKTLTPIRIHQVTSERWRASHPSTQVLQRPLVEKIDYSHSPFMGFITNARLLFPVKGVDDRFHPKEVVVLLRRGDASRAYLGSVLTEKGGEVEDDFGGTVRIRYDGEEAVFDVEEPEGVAVEEAYWFSVRAFRPEVEVFGR